MTETKVEFPSKKPMVLWFTLILSVLIVAIQILRVFLLDKFFLYFFFGVFFELSLYLVYVGVFIWSVIFFLRNKKANFQKAILPSTIQIVTILVVFFLPLTYWVVKADFLLNYQSRNTVVQLVETGRLKYDSSQVDVVKLPPEFAYLSNGGGEILVEQEGSVTKVLFFTVRGVTDNFSGLIYISDNGEPNRNDFGGDLNEINKLDDHWFYAIST